MSYVYNPVRDLIGVAKIHVKRSPVRDDIPETKDEYRLAPIVEEIFLFFKKPFDCAQGDNKMKQIAEKNRTFASPIHFVRPLQNKKPLIAERF